MSEHTLGAWLSFTLYFAAAMHDADEEQRRRMRRRMGFVIRRLRNDDPAVWKPALKDAFTVMHEVMGPEWEPTGDRAAQIAKLMP